MRCVRVEVEAVTFVELDHLIGQGHVDRTRSDSHFLPPDVSRGRIFSFRYCRGHPCLSATPDY